MMHLELAIASNSDLYKRRVAISALIIINNKKKYKIDRLIRKRQRRFKCVK